MCQQGRTDEGVTMMAAAIAINEERGALLNRPMFLCLLAEGEARGPDSGRALVLVDQALAIRGEEQLFESDMYRRRGELLASAGRARRDEAAADLCRAIAIAERQGAVAFRRRAEAALAVLGRSDTGVSAAAGTRGAEVAFPGSGDLLTRREREVLALVGRGRTDNEIGAELGISVATVHTHLDRIRDKTGQRRRFGLVKVADVLGLTAK
ncbi:MAG: LuxR C-terminal-related transcriptional regulator [Actinomycetota bacterium]|nr:LuxR C-terminal-related transcriptional regulator [Actinomycetota bacterium]